MKLSLSLCEPQKTLKLSLSKNLIPIKTQAEIKFFVMIFFQLNTQNVWDQAKKV